MQKEILKKRDLFVKTVEWCDNSQYDIKKIIEIKIQKFKLKKVLKISGWSSGLC